MGLIDLTFICRFPEQYGKKQCIVNVETEDLEDYKPQCTYLNLPCDEDVFNLCTLILSENEFPIPDRNMDVDIAFHIYKFLITELRSYGLT